MTDSHDRPALRPTLLLGVWALPVFGVLLTLSTLTHQPSAQTDFPAYAAYVTGPWFLPSHLVGSIVGAAFGIVGVLSAALVVAQRRDRTAGVLVGAVLSVLAHVLNTAVFGVAAFAQSAIGRAYEAGLEDAVAIDADVYGPELVSTVLVAFVLWTAGAVLVGRAVATTSPSLRAAGTTYAVALPLFYLAGPVLGVVQPVFGAAFTVAAVVLARRLPAATAAPVLPSSAGASRALA